MSQNRKLLTRVVTAALAAACFTWAGCNDSSTPTEAGHGANGAPASHDADDHSDHDHGDHDDHAGHNHAEMGEHGGHIVVLDPGHLHAEWVHADEEETLEIYIIDEVEVTGVKVVSKVNDAEPTTVELAAIEGDTPRAFSVKNPNVLTNISMADGEMIKVTLVVETADGEITASLTDDHDHHDH